MKLNIKEYKTLSVFRNLLKRRRCLTAWKRNFLEGQKMGFLGGKKVDDITNEDIKNANFEDIALYILRKAKAKDCYRGLSHRPCRISPLEYFLGHSELTFIWSCTKEKGIFWHNLFLEFTKLMAENYG